MDANETTAAIQRYLDNLAGVRGVTPVEPIVSALLARATDRIHRLFHSGNPSRSGPKRGETASDQAASRTGN
jgi:hypothetical protein